MMKFDGRFQRHRSHEARGIPGLMGSVSGGILGLDSAHRFVLGGVT